MEQITQDIMEIICQLIKWFSNLNYLILLSIIGLHFFYQWKEKNYIQYPLLLYNIFHPKYTYRYIRYTIVVMLVFLFISHFTYSVILRNYDNYEFNEFLANNVKKNYFQYFILVLILNSVIYRIFRKKINKYINTDFENRNRRSKNVYLKYIFFTISSFIVQTIVIIAVSSLVKVIDSALISNEYLPLEMYQNLDLKFTYHRGVYIAVFFSFCIVFLLFNAIIKSFNKRYNLQDFVIYSFVLIIVGFGSFSGLYCIANYWINFSVFGYYSDWTTQDKLIGSYAVRITSLLLFWSILKFVYKGILNERILEHVINGFLPIDPVDSEKRRLGKLTGTNSNYFDNIFFAQVGFYILNVFTAEYLVSNLDIDRLTTILFLLLPIMVDDFFVIHVYHKKFNYIENWHAIKIWGFNILLLIFSISALYVDLHFIILVIYVLISVILFLIYKYR